MKLKLKNNIALQQPLLVFKPIIIKKKSCAKPLLVHNDAAKKIWISLLQELEAAGVSKKMIAQKSNISIKTLTRLENGSVKEPTYLTFKKLLAFYCSSIIGLSE